MNLKQIQERYSDANEPEPQPSSKQSESGSASVEEDKQAISITQKKFYESIMKDLQAIQTSISKISSAISGLDLLLDKQKDQDQLSKQL